MKKRYHRTRWTMKEKAMMGRPTKDEAIATIKTLYGTIKMKEKIARKLIVPSHIINSVAGATDITKKS